MSLIKAMQFASRVRKKFKVGRKPKKQGLRGGMWAKKRAIGAAYNVQAFGAGVTAGGDDTVSFEHENDLFMGIAQVADDSIARGFKRHHAL